MQLPSVAETSNFSRSSTAQLNSISQKVQRYLANPHAHHGDGHLEGSKVDPRLRLSMSSVGRPSSAKQSSRSTFTVSNIAPMVRRPSTAPQKRPVEILEEVRAKAMANSKLGTQEDDGDINDEEGEEGEEEEDEDEEGELLDEGNEEEGKDEDEEVLGSHRGSRQDSLDGSEELIVMKPKSSNGVPKPNKRYNKNKNKNRWGMVALCRLIIFIFIVLICSNWLFIIHVLWHFKVQV